MQLNIALFENFLMEVLNEDVGNGDVTTNSLLDSKQNIKFSIVSRQELVLCGVEIAKWYLNKFGINQFRILAEDGDMIGKNATIIDGQGDIRTILLLERIILNFLQHLSGVATLTSQFVATIAHTRAKITDTRKTIPGLRKLQKYAVTCGGGHNHRLSLDSAIMIKDNHIAACNNDIEAAVKLATIKAPHYTKVIVECDNLIQLELALKAGATIILLDNMSITELIKAVQINKGRAILEASGGVNLSTVKSIAETGVDIIAVGQLTHSAPAVDIGLDM